jgi:serine/threonine-protein kinase
MPVRKVGTCEIVRELGRGGMGVVYEAMQPSLNRRVAIKELPSELARNKEFTERFFLEGKVYASLRHQAIVSVYDLIEKNDAYYLITELVDGADLAKLLQQGPLPPACVALVGAQLAEALSHVHFHKLLHRDIKPANVMVTRTGDVKLMDFGIAKDQTADDLTQEGLLVGSPSYLAPEVLLGERNDPQSDLWALGVTLYELCAGVRPFTGKDQGALFLAVRKGRFAPLRSVAPGVPRRLAKAIERCLELKARKRWSSASELAVELEVCAGKFLDGFHPQARLAALMANRGFPAPPDEHTAISADSLVIAADEDTRAKLPPPARRWPLRLALLTAAACAGAAYWAHLHF